MATDQRWGADRRAPAKAPRGFEAPRGFSAQLPNGLRGGLPGAVWRLAFAAMVFVAGLAQAADRHFALTYVGDGNAARAEGFITLADAVLPNPGNEFNDAGTVGVVQLTIVVAGASTGNGTFTDDAIANYLWSTNGATLDLGADLFGQPTTGEPFGTNRTGTAGDFNFFAVGGTMAPNGTAPFELTTNENAGDVILLSAMDSVVADIDADGLDNHLELELGSNPRVADTDGDGLLDGAEVSAGTSLLVADTDVDGLLDGAELGRGGTWLARPIDNDPTINQSNFSRGMVVTGDLNGDGAPDVVAALHDPGVLAWYENSGGRDAAFDPTNGRNVISAAFAGSRSVAVGDVDGDGDADVVAAAGGFDGGGAASRIVWFENTDGAGAFAAPERSVVVFGSETTVARLLVRDLNSDGRPDVIAATISSADAGVFVYLNGGGGAFAGGRIDPPISFNYVGLAIGDLDGDRVPDIVWGTSDGDVAWQRNDGQGGFGPRQAIVGSPPIFATVRDLDVGDFDGDGDLDVAYANPGASSIFWHQNDGAGAFGLKFAVTRRTASANALVVADLNGDGKVDVLGAAGGTSAVSWFANDGTGAFDPDGITLGETFVSRTFESLTTADIDGDGDLDAVSLLSGFSWYENVSPSDPLDADTDDDGLSDGFEVANVCTSLLCGAPLALPLDPAVADSDGDGIPDGLEDDDADGLTHAEEEIFGSDPFAADRDGDGLDDQQERTAGTDPANADSDSDGMPDGFEWTFDQTASDAFDPLNADANGNGQRDGVDDSDADGLGNRAEFLVGTNPQVADTDEDTLADGDEIGTAAFADVVMVNAARFGAGAEQVLLADIDTDGRPDIIGLYPAEDELSWHRNLGAPDTLSSIAFGPAQVISVFDRVGTAAAAVADLDGDGDVDVVSASTDDDRVAWYRNRSERNLAPQSTERFGAFETIGRFADASLVAVGDLDADGAIDVVAGVNLRESSTAHPIVWYRNTGDGQFGMSQQVAAPMSGVRAIAIGDLDQDGRRDVAVFGNFSQVLWYRNTESGFVAQAVDLAAPVGPSANSIRIGDINGDGLLDLATSIAWYRNLGGGAFGTAQVFCPSCVRDGVADLNLADVEGDGDIDAVVSRFFPDRPFGELGFYKNVGAGAFEPAFTVITDGSFGFSLGVDVADLDGDGDLDLATAVANQAGILFVEQTNVADPTLADTDRDGFADAAELAAGSDPRNPDSDGDGMHDGFEIAFGFDPAVADAASDGDGDGLSNVEEAMRCRRPDDPASCTSPLLADTDDDGVGDKREFDVGLDPLSFCDLDQTAPSTNVGVGVGDEQFAQNSFPVSLSCADALPLPPFSDARVVACGGPRASGCLATQFALNDDPLAPHVGDFAVSITDRLHYQSEDRAGNLEAGQTHVGGVFTTLSIGLSSRSILLEPPEGFMLGASIGLKIPGRDVTALDLTGLTVNLSVIDPDGLPVTLTDGDGTDITSALTNEDGFITMPNLAGFTKAGEYRLTAEFDGTAVLGAASSKATSLVVGSAAGYALLVQGRIAGGEGQRSHDKTAQTVYDSFIERGLDPDDIIYLSFTGFDQARPEVDGRPSRQAIREALGVCRQAGTGTDGAACDVPVLGLCSGDTDESCLPLGDRMRANPAPLHLAWIDHGTAGGSPAEPQFHIETDTSGEVVTPEELHAWLATLEADADVVNLPNQKERIAVLGFCYSGSFIDPLFDLSLGAETLNGRVVIASASATEESYRGLLEPGVDGGGPIRPGEFFVEELFAELRDGVNYRDAFVRATESTEAFTRKGGRQTALAPFNDSAIQHPLLEDDGEPTPMFGSNALLNGTGDGERAATVVLGFGGVTNAVSEPARIVKVTPTQYLPVGQFAVVLSARVNNNNRVANGVFIELRKPDQELVDNDPSRSVSLQRDIVNEVNQLTTFLVDGLWQRTVPEFAAPGRYEAFYKVRDSETEEFSRVVRSVIYKNFAGNQSPSTFAMRAPLQSPGDPPIALDTGNNLFRWQPSVDPVETPCPVNAFCDEAVTYNFVIVRTDTGAEVYRQDVLKSTALPLDLRPLDLNETITYQWSVEAVDGFGARVLASNAALGRFVVKPLVNAFGFPDLVVRQTVSPASPSLGEVVTVLIEVLNPGGLIESTARNVALTMQLPPQATLQLVMDDDGVCAFDAVDTVQCQFDEIPASASVAKRATVMMQVVTAGEITSAVSLLYPQDDGPSNNVNTQTLLVLDGDGGAIDTDGDGIVDSLDPDDDNDGVLDDDDAFPKDANESVDTDGDGLGDRFADDDDDGDGLSDQAERDNGLDPLNSADADGDADGDGVDNRTEIRLGFDPQSADSLPPLQLVQGDGVALRGVVGRSIEVPISYSTSDGNNNLSGIGVRVHFDSSKLAFEEVVSVLAKDLIGVDTTVVFDAADDDNDPATDRIVNAAWASAGGDWPGSALPADLLTLRFGVLDSGEVESTTMVRFTTSATANGYLLDATPIMVTTTNASFDIDGNGRIEALTDGLLILRHLFGFSGDNLSRGVVANDCTTCTDEALRAALVGLDSALDVDASGRSEALADGVLILRHLFSFRGAALTAGAVSPDAARSDAEVEAHLNAVLQ